LQDQIRKFRTRCAHRLEMTSTGSIILMLTNKNRRKSRGKLHWKHLPACEDHDQGRDDAASWTPQEAAGWGGCCLTITRMHDADALACCCLCMCYVLHTAACCCICYTPRHIISLACCISLHVAHPAACCSSTGNRLAGGGLGDQ
jgi:hypothetical protein